LRPWWSSTFNGRTSTFHRNERSKSCSERIVKSRVVRMKEILNRYDKPIRKYAIAWSIIVSIFKSM
jgi:hypothetical protein